MVDVVPEFANRGARVPHIPHALSPSPVVLLSTWTNFHLSSLAFHVKVAPFPVRQFILPTTTMRHTAKSWLQVLVLYDTSNHSQRWPPSVRCNPRFTRFHHFPPTTRVSCGECGPGYLSTYCDSLRAGRSGDRIPVRKRFSAPVQTGPGAHPASNTMGTGSFAGAGRDVDHSPHLAPRLKKEYCLHGLF